MSKRTRRNHSSEQKAAMLKRHHLEKVPVSDLCDENTLQPSVFYGWQRQLFALTPYVLRNLEKSLGAGLVEDLEFRVVPRRREPQRAEQSAPALLPERAADEADGIADPVLRDIYRASRKRAQA